MIVTFENRRIIIPNAVIGDEVIVNSNVNDEGYLRVRRPGRQLRERPGQPALGSVMQAEFEARADSLDKRTPREDIKRGAPKMLLRLIASRTALLQRAYALGEGPGHLAPDHYDLNRSIKLRFRPAAEGIVIPTPSHRPHRHAHHREERMKKVRTPRKQDFRRGRSFSSATMTWPGR
ncbi:MAG: mechanosensitive ion channel family protein [Flavobacteriales bacterium]|nr:mechanosensitive ion channel family protein [Flavobacteriales bacterium]